MRILSGALGLRARAVPSAHADGDIVITDVAVGGDVAIGINGSKTFGVRRLAQLSVNAAPEPVRKNAKLTVTGTLIHVDWFARATTSV